MMRPRLPRPEKIDSDLWIDEAIWGHRLYDEQTPWMTLLEMLGVLNAQAAAGRPFREDDGCRGVEYAQTRRLALRNLLFNNPFIEDTLRRTTDDAERWLRWTERMKAHAEGLGESIDFGYLRDVFPAGGALSDSFGDFARVVGLLRGTAIEGDSNKRWTSKFVFPYGPACLFPDLRVDARGAASMDRRFFARTGELVYLMLCRSGLGPALFAEFQRTVCNEQSPWNRLVARLQPPEAPTPGGTTTGYLPFAALPEYSEFAGDLLALLRTRLPGYDVLPHLVDLIGLHLVRYLLGRAAEWTPGEPEPCMVLEIIAPKRTTVRDLAVETFQANSQRSVAAVEGFIAREVEGCADWRDACALDDDGERRAALRAVLWDKVRWDDARPQGEGAMSSDPGQLLRELRSQAQKRHEAHLGEVHARYAQAIGLASRRGTRRVRYAPNDQLLKSLVLAVVPERMEFQEFLDALWGRYRMIVGHHQAREYLRDGRSDQVAFEENARRLEMRLASLGLLRRLSDACAYVENPMGVDP